MTITRKCIIDIGKKDKFGITYVALSRCSLFKNIILIDFTEERFKDYLKSGGDVQKE